MASGVTAGTLDDLRAGRDQALQRLGRGLEPMQRGPQAPGSTSAENSRTLTTCSFLIFQLGRAV